MAARKDNNITKQKCAEIALRESKEQDGVMADNMPIHLGITDNSGVFVVWNKFSEQLFGYTAEEVVGKMRPAILHESEEEAVLVKRIAAEKGIFDGESVLVRKDGSRFIAHLRVVSKRNSDGKITGFYGFAEDITKRKEAERKLQAYSESLEQMVRKRTKDLDCVRAELFSSAKLAAMGRMGAGIAHQLNSPIYGGMLLVESLMDDLKNMPELKDRLKRLKTLFDDMHDIIECMLSLAGVGRGDRRGHLSVSINDLLKRIIDLSALEINKYKIATMFDFDRIDLHIKATAGELEQVFLNIVNNAIDAMPKGGTLFISTRKSEKHVGIHIKDTGEGIAAEDIDKIFEPFFTKRWDRRGVGLGLAIVHQMIERIGGKIQVESVLGKGADFLVTLPLASKLPR